MSHIFRKIITHPLISLSAISVIGANAANAFNLLFTVFMARNLSEADFGIFTSLNSLIVLPLLVATGLAPIIVNFAAPYFAEKRLDLVHGFYNKMALYYFTACTILLVIFLLFSPYLAHFFHISETQIIILTGIAAFIGLVTTLNTAFLQAKLAFIFISVIVFLNTISKLFFGVSFVFMGWGVSGAIISILISGIFLLLLSFIPLRFVFKKAVSASPIPRKELISYGLPAGLAIFGLTMFISTDIFLVKHFFTPEMAGIYASVELMGKIVYFLTSSVATVMFPIIVQKRAKDEAYLSTFFLGLALVMLPSIILTSLYFLFPEFIINVITRKESVAAYGSLLGFFGIIMTIYSLVGVFTYFYLSLKKTVVAYPILLCAILQGVLIWIYHDSFFQVMTMTCLVLLLLLVGLLLYYPHATKK